MARIAEKNFYRDAEGNLVEENDPKVAFLVAAKGTEIPQEVIDQYSIPEEAPVEEPAPEPAEKKAAAPAANKSVTPAANKGAKK